ncbi:MAG: glutamate racemase [Anaerolineaceae bacterium]
MTDKPAPLVGVFDSGVGGFSVLRSIQSLYPDLSLVYLGDQAHVPYGRRPVEEIQRYSRAITEWLIERGAVLIVVACNTASAVALYHLREIFPTIPFVGMEPAVKPAAELTHTGKVGILATPATFQGQLYASVVERFAKDVVIYPDTCAGLVEEIEKGSLRGSATRQILERALNPMLAAGIDTVVMGCTHYPFVIPLIREIAGDSVRVIDPAPAIARQVGRLLRLVENGEAGRPEGSRKFFTTGQIEQMRDVLPVLLGQAYPVRTLSWQDDRLMENN